MTKKDRLSQKRNVFVQQRMSGLKAKYGSSIDDFVTGYLGPLFAVISKASPHRGLLVVALGRHSTIKKPGVINLDKKTTCYADCHQYLVSKKMQDFNHSEDFLTDAVFMISETRSGNPKNDPKLNIDAFVDKRLDGTCNYFFYMLRG